MAGYAAAFVCLALGSWISALQRAGRHADINRAAISCARAASATGRVVAFAAYGVISAAHPLHEDGAERGARLSANCKVRKRNEDRFRKRRLEGSHG